jgi:glycosyltransferase involved in cell wall biosynthesis
VKLVFVDVGHLEYDADTPFAAPLGGSQSAAVYLAAELGALGIEVAFVNDVKTARMSRGVRFVGHDHIRGDFLNRFDVVIVLSAAVGAALRRDAGIIKPLVLWTQHAHDQPAIQNLTNADERQAWTALAMVSDWQADGYHRQFGLDRAGMVIKRNAASPAFLEIEPAQPWFLTGAPPVLAYTSTPFRGLDVLLTAFPTIRKAVPDATLRVFSGMAVYQAADTYSVLYELCRALPGAEYVGSVPQRDLAREMRGVAALAYPSTFAETSCITVMEAMAAGAMILSTNLGALPETAHGFGQLLGLKGSRVDVASAYAAMVIEALQVARDRPAEAAARLEEQVRFARSQYTWQARAKEWRDWLSALSTAADARSQSPAER